MQSLRINAAILTILLVLPVAAATLCAYFVHHCTMEQDSQSSSISSTMDCCLSCVDLATARQLVQSRWEYPPPALARVIDFESRPPQAGMDGKHGLEVLYPLKYPSSDLSLLSILQI